MKDKNHLRRLSMVALLSLATLGMTAQTDNVTVTGTVTDANGETVIGASVVPKGKAGAGVVTDFDGRFTITVPKGSTLQISYIGMKMKDVKVSSSGTANLSVTLEDESFGLQDVVVVGYGQQKKASVVGSISQTTGEVLERAGGVSSVGAALTGNLPGVTTMQSTGMPGEEDPEIVIRGASSWNNASPLYW